MMFSCLIFSVFISAIFGMAGAGETGLEREQSRNQSYACCTTYLCVLAIVIFLYFISSVT